jgi:hypothetical protein
VMRQKSSRVGDEAKVVDVEKDIEEGHGIGVRESQVGMVTLDGVDEVGDVESPKEGRKTTDFRQTFEDLDVGDVVGESVEDTVHEGVLEYTDALPEVRWDMVIMESNEELVAGNGRESQFDITEEFDGRVVSVGVCMLVRDVREEGVNCVEGLTVWLTLTLRLCEETGLEGVM